MKNFTLVTVLAAFITFTSLISSCGKSKPESNKSIEAVAGNWMINRVQAKIYYGGVFFKDTIISNGGLYYANFNTAGMVFSFQYKTPAADVGTYITKGSDSVIATTSTTVYRWKMLTLTDKLFTASSTSNSHPDFPGATVETYYTLIK